jgi:hypothetical protein
MRHGRQAREESVCQPRLGGGSSKRRLGLFHRNGKRTKNESERSDCRSPHPALRHPNLGLRPLQDTLNALKFKQAYKKRTDLVKDAMSTVPAGDRAAMVNVIMDAIKKGGLFARADGGARQHHNDDGHPVLKFKTQKGETFNQKVHRAHRRCANDNSEWWSGGGLP